MQLYRPIPAYEWVKSLSALPVNCLFARDLAQFWYLYGLSGVDDIQQSAGELRDFIATHGIERLVVFGASTGGYAALVFGSLLGADEVHAFVPMVTLPSRKLIASLRLLPSHNWTLLRKQLALRWKRSVGRGYRDTRKLLRQDNGRTIYHVYYGQGHPPDRVNAERLRELPRVNLHPYDYNRHYLLERLKESGELGILLDTTYRRVSAGNRAYFAGATL